MRLIRTIILFALLGYGVIFCVMNMQKVSLHLPLVAKFDSVPLFIVIVGCIVTGLLVAEMAGMGRSARNFIAQSSARKEAREIKKKLDIFETEQKIRHDIQLQDTELQNRITDKPL